MILRDLSGAFRWGRRQPDQGENILVKSGPFYPHTGAGSSSGALYSGPLDTENVNSSCAKQMSERGIILMIVLWVLLILTVIAWTCSRQAQMGLRMTSFQTDSVRAYYLARAGVARAMVFLREDKLKDHGVLGIDDLIDVDDKDQDWLYDAPSEAWGFNPDAYGIDPDEDADEWGATLENARGSFTVEVEDISGRINVNFAVPSQIGHLLTSLGFLGRYSTAMAMAIVDYIDQDDQPTFVEGREAPPGWEFGDLSSEDYYYNPGQSRDEVDTLGPRFVMKNGPLACVEELLLIPGMTDHIYYGEDLNGNGELDENEDDGDESPPNDNADGELQLGLRDYVTVFSGLSSQVGAKVNINSAPYDVLRAQSVVTTDTQDIDEYIERSIRIADKIIDYRNGNDGILGTDDDRKFRTLPHTDENDEGVDKAGLTPEEEAIVNNRFGVASDYFRIRATGEVNEVKKTLKVTVVRTFQEELELDQDRGTGSRFDRERERVEQVRLLIIDFEEEG